MLRQGITEAGTQAGAVFFLNGWQTGREQAHYTLETFCQSPTSSRLHLPKSPQPPKIAQPAGDQMFKAGICGDIGIEILKLPFSISYIPD